SVAGRRRPRPTRVPRRRGRRPGGDEGRSWGRPGCECWRGRRARGKVSPTVPGRQPRVKRFPRTLPHGPMPPRPPLLLAALLAAAPLRAADPPARVERDVAVPMRDGTILRADVHRPAGPGPFPVLVSRT